MAIYCLSVQVWFVTSIQKLILNITDFELPHELLNNLKLRILGNYEILGKSQNWVGTRSRMFSLPARNNFLTIVFKNNTNTDIKVFCSCLNFLNFLNFCQIFSGYQYFRTNLSKNHSLSLNFSVPFPWLSMTFPVQKGKPHNNRPFQNYNLLTVKSLEYFEKNFGPI